MKNQRWPIRLCQWWVYLMCSAALAASGDSNGPSPESNQTPIKSQTRNPAGSIAAVNPSHAAQPAPPSAIRSRGVGPTPRRVPSQWNPAGANPFSQGLQGAGNQAGAGGMTVDSATIPRVLVAPIAGGNQGAYPSAGGFGTGGIRFVTVRTPTSFSQTIARQFLAGTRP